MASIIGAAGEGNMGQAIARRFAAEGALVTKETTVKLEDGSPLLPAGRPST